MLNIIRIFFPTVKGGIIRLFYFFQIAFLTSPCFCLGQNNFVKVIERSNFIFLGTVVKMDTSNIQAHAVGRTAILKVNQVIDAPKPYFKMKDMEVTLQFAADTPHAAGDKQVFYTTAWYFGETLGLREIDNSLPKKFTSKLSAQIQKARSEVSDRILYARLDNATVVVKGTVLQANLDTANYLFSSSEHDPALRRAIIKVEENLKGDQSGTLDSVYYPTGNDIMWTYAPKITQGMDAIFVLRPSYSFSSGLGGYILLNTLDVQSSSNVNKIKQLLK